MYSTRTFFLFLVLAAMLAAPGHALAGVSGVVIACVTAAGAALACWRWADRFLLKLYDARAVQYAEYPQLFRTLQRLSLRAGIPMPRLYVIPERAPNAFATGRNREHAAVAVTEGLTRLLNDAEIEAVVAFEVARIASGDTLATSVVAAAAGAVSSVVNFALWGTLGARGEEGRRNGVMARVAARFHGLLARFVRLHARSLAADRKSAAWTENPLALASALEKIEAYSRLMTFFTGSRETGMLFIQNPFPGEGVEPFRTHPRTRDRVTQLWQMARKLRTAA